MAAVQITLAATTTDAGDLTGWWIGITLGVVVVLVVAAIAVTLIVLATRIRRQAGMAVEALDSAHHNTRALWDVATTNRTAKAVLEGAVRAREAVEGSL